MRNSDCIMVLEQGRIIERGTHDELIEKKGKYYSLYTGNFSEETAWGGKHPVRLSRAGSLLTSAQNPLFL